MALHLTSLRVFFRKQAQVRIFHYGSSCSNVSSFLVCSLSFKCFYFFIDFVLLRYGSYVCRADDFLIDCSKKFS